MEKETFNHHLIQLVIGLQSTAWMALGKTINPTTGKTEVNLELAKDSIDTLLMLKEKTKGNVTKEEETILDNAMADLELNFIQVKKQAEKESQEKKETTEEKKD